MESVPDECVPHLVPREGSEEAQLSRRLLLFPLGLEVEVFGLGAAAEEKDVG